VTIYTVRFRYSYTVQAFKPLSQYKDNLLSQDEGIVSAYRSGDYTMEHISDKFKVHYSTVSRAIKKAEMNDCKTPFTLGFAT
jgi:predicted DNA-binding protein YlxM (UPF0122 family)